MNAVEIVLLPCPNGCGCIEASDPDRLDCACDGPCCFAEDWPLISVVVNEQDA